MAKVIMGIQLFERMNDSAKFQTVLSKYGCHINTRLGLHAAASDSCSPSGLIILDFIDGAEKEADAFEQEVSKLESVRIQKMIF